MTSLIDFPSVIHGNDRMIRGSFAEPRKVLMSHRADEVMPILDEVYALALAGHWCVGYLRYEAASAFDEALSTHAADGPLVWFGIYDEISPWPNPVGASEPTLDWRSELSRDAFDKCMARIHEAISAGEIYQLNYTAPLFSPFD